MTAGAFVWEVKRVHAFIDRVSLFFVKDFLEKYPYDSKKWIKSTFQLHETTENLDMQGEILV